MFHTILYVWSAGGDAPLHLGRRPSKDCEPLVCSSCDAYETQTLVAPSSATFVAHIGPSGDQRGYMGITGESSLAKTTLYCDTYPLAMWGWFTTVFSESYIALF